MHVLTQPERIFLYELIAPAIWHTGVHLRKLGRWGSETLLLTNDDFWTCFHHFSSYKIFFNEDTTYLPHIVYFIKPIIQQHEQLTIHSTIVFTWGIHKNIKEQEKLKNCAGELKPCWRHAEQTGTIESWGAVSNLYYWAQCLDSKENRWLCNMEMAPWKALSIGMLQ